MNNSIRNYPVNMFRICVDVCTSSISGHAHSPMCEKEIAFTGIGELVLKMDKLFDSVGYPQGFQDKRSFEDAERDVNAYKGIPKAVRTPDNILEQAGKCCTFDVLVESRRNTSWQGAVFDKEGREQGKFNGEVALLEQLNALTKK